MNLSVCAAVTALILTFFQAVVTFLNLCGSSVPEIYYRLPKNKVFNFQLAVEAVLVLLSVLSLCGRAGGMSVGYSRLYGKFNNILCSGFLQKYCSSEAQRIIFVFYKSRNSYFNA